MTDRLPQAGSGAMAPRQGLPRLFSELCVGKVVLKNRIVSPGHDTVMAEGGHVSEQLVAYQQARAEGGVGLIVMQAAGVHDSARYTYHVLMADEDSCIPGYRKVVDAVRPHGCRLFGQLFHPGREVMESQDGSAPVALAPSAVPNERFHVMPRALTVELIEEIVAGYGSAGRRLREAGLDGVEVVASHGYLPSQFLNPRANVRSDAYGGTFHNRMRFLEEVLVAIRREVGEDFVVGVRISADELEDDGLSADDALAACVRLDKSGTVDYLSVTLGTSATLAGSDHIVPPMSEAVGYAMPHIGRVKQRVGVPVFAAGRINQPQDAERILVDGLADAVIMNRALICDPTMPRLAEEGRLDDIRACIACNQACIGHFHLGYPISCIQHPETGRELAFGRRPASNLRAVMVVGGGPAGLKAAAVAAERGHSVTLYEAAPRVGGQVLLAAQLPDREEFGGAASNLLWEAERAGVEIVTRTTVEAALIGELQPDVVVVATGARPRRPMIEVLGNPTILDAWEVIRGSELPEGRIVVADWKGDWIGAGVATLLARRGRHRVVLAVDGYQACGNLQQYVKDAHLTALARAKVDVVPLVRLFGADGDAVYFQHVLTKEPVVIEHVSGLVLAEGHEPVDDLLLALAAIDPAATEVVGVGDCLAPRSVEEAVLEGLVAASRL